MASSGDTCFFSKTGERIEKTDFLLALSRFKGNVVLLGENHMDPASHVLEMEVLKRLHEEIEGSEKKMGLSLEFYDREAQTVLNEYLVDLVDKETFLQDSNPPGNYEDYQPMIDYCKERGIPVIASNCPRRYTRMVSRLGRDKLAESAAIGAGHLLPPMPYDGASDKYKQNFIDTMRAIGNDNPNVPTRMLDAQSLWDATMADSISQNLKRLDLVVHVAGYFHIKNHLGICEHLGRYSPDCEFLTAVILPEENPTEFKREEHEGLGDFVVLTDLSKV